MSASMNPLPVAPAVAAACTGCGAPSSAAFDTGLQVHARATGCVHGARGRDVVRCDRAGLAVTMVARGALIEAEVDRHSVREAAA